MFKKDPARLILLVFIGVALALTAWWYFFDPVKSFNISVPGMDNRKKGSPASQEAVKIGSEFKFFKAVEDIPGTSWPRFRGSGFDNICREPVKLIGHWGKEGPSILWKIPVGDGHAAPAVYRGKVYLLDYDESSKTDQLRCLLLTTGEELWRRGYKVHLKRNHGLSRTIPAVNDKFVLTIGPRCQVMCVKRGNGDFLWGVDIEKEYNSEIPFWYTGQCPLLDQDTAVIATGGKAILAAFDCNTGKKLWETPNPRGWKMSHASVMPMVFQEKKMYVYCAIGGVCAIAASGADRGRVLWETTAFSPSVVAPSPVILDNGKILVTAGYGAGSALLQVTGTAGKFNVEIVQMFKPQEGMASEQQTPIFSGGCVYGILPKDAGGLRNQLACCRPGDCRKIIMSSGKTDRFGLGPYILADGKFFILNDDGEMTIATATSSRFTVLDKARIIDGQDSWGPMAITGGFLLMRDSKQLVCLDIKAK